MASPLKTQTGAVRADAATVWSPSSPEARVLAASLRCARVTLLHGADAASRSALLRQGVLPLLGRHPAGMETVRLVQDWDALPLPSLADFIDERQWRDAAALLAGPAGAPPAPLTLLVLDGVDRLFRLPQHRPDVATFICELVDLMFDRPRTLNLLIATEDPAQHALLELAWALPGFGERVLKLGAGAPSRAPAVDRRSWADAAVARRAA